MENPVAFVVVHAKVEFAPRVTDAGLTESVQTGAGGGGGDEQFGAVMVSVSVVTVPPNANALPVQVVLAPTVIPALLMTVPRKFVLAPSVVAALGVQKTSQADAPFIVT